MPGSAFEGNSRESVAESGSDGLDRWVPYLFSIAGTPSTKNEVTRRIRIPGQMGSAESGGRMEGVHRPPPMATQTQPPKKETAVFNTKKMEPNPKVFA